jgi:hypothetical protein
MRAEAAELIELTLELDRGFLGEALGSGNQVLGTTPSQEPLSKAFFLR